MLNKNLIALSLMVVLGFACSGTATEKQTDEAELVAEQDGVSSDNNPRSKETKIFGVINGGGGSELVLQHLRPNSIAPIDTVIIESDGSYEFEFKLEKPGYYRISLGETNLFVLIVEAGDEIRVDADASNLYQTYKIISGSNESVRLAKLNGILGKRDSINMAVQQAQVSQNQAAFESAMAEYDGVMEEVGNQLLEFVNENPGSFSSLAALQNMNIDADYELFVLVIDELREKGTGSEFYEAMRMQVEQLKRLAVGSVAPEIALPQPNGEVLKLSDLRGQYVLIDFWASWCGPCRRENPNVRRMYNQYHENGFEILGVSLDKNKSAWLQAIEQDGLTWKHVSDLQYWQSAVVQEYQIQGIPLTYLVGPEGKIIARNLRGSSLEKKLAEIFGQ